MVSAFEYGTLLLLVAIVGLRLDCAAAAPMRGREASQGCQRSSSDLLECVSASVQQFVNFVSSGKISPKHLITPFDPLYLPNMTIFQEKRVKAVYVNRYLVGLKNAFIEDVRVDMEKLEFNMTTLMPALEMLGMFSTERLEDHQATENSILTFSIRNTVVDFVAKGTLYRAPSGDQYLRLQLGISSMSIASYVLSEHLGSEQHLSPAPSSSASRFRGSSGGSSTSSSIAPTKFMKLIERDLRVQLTKRLQHVVNEALALAPFEELFPV
uniref:Secreted protein n=1 Tax=Anopheles atroparvus TaxID=41427 RepID=A0AAG5CW17_ANOAO